MDEASGAVCLVRQEEGFVTTVLNEPTPTILVYLSLYLRLAWSLSLTRVPWVVQTFT